MERRKDMAFDLLGIEIPNELLLYENQRIKSNNAAEKILSQCSKVNGTKILRNQYNEIECSEHYNDFGELSKKVYYKASCIVKEQRFHNNKLIAEDCYLNDYITSKTSYDLNGNIRLRYEYEYNNEKNIISITKKENDKCYTVRYGYDNLYRVNYREIIINDKTIQKQHYKIDVLDRIVEYTDDSQRIVVSKFSSDGKLITYSITDNLGNQIIINNNINFGEYINTKMSLNGHETIVNNSKYLENAKLIKPTATEVDLNKIITQFSSQEHPYQTTRRNNYESIADTIINNKSNNVVVPILLRKRILYAKMVEKCAKTA